MNLTPKKVHYQVGPRSFIRFNGKPQMIIEVFKYENREDAIKAAEKIELDMKVLGMPFLSSDTSSDQFVYLLVATQFPLGVPEMTTPQQVKNLTRLMSKLSYWYHFTIIKKLA